MEYNFDKLIDRRGTDTVKFDRLQELYGRSDLLPLWVADMDFECPPCITEALRRRLDHPLYGYTIESDIYWSTIIQWILEHHGWEVQREWMTYIPGIVKGIGLAINALVGKDEKVIIQPPVYHPFRLVPEGNKRDVVMNPLIELPEGGYRMNFENLEKVADASCRMLILSNPHNPAGIVWDRETLERLADICYRRGIIVISDEIHCDMALWGNKHIPFASVSEKAAACSITFGAPSKTFNIAGIVSSYAIVPDAELRRRFYSWLDASELGHSHLFAPIATIAAFSEGESWRQAMLRYVEGNVDFVSQYCADRIPRIKPLRPQASFLVWLDCRELQLSHEALIDLFVNKARLALNDGAMFGIGGEGFMRLNVGTSRSILQEAMERLAYAVASLE
ncbi:MAG: putative C-S lyase [Rikenellaceae bacterium]|nr:putative C-S lyase [Rikenellaceae bacterium]